MKCPVLLPLIVCVMAVNAFCAVPSKETLIAHRGESIDAPENTLPAYKMAVERGFGFECDIYLSKDKRVFTFHDNNLKRTTGGINDKWCWQASWAEEISKLDVGNWGKWLGSKYTGTRPALLEEVLDLAIDGKWLYVELKPGPEIVPYVRDIFARQRKATPENTLFISFLTNTCKAIKREMPQYKVFWLSNDRNGWTPDSPPKCPDDIISVLQEIGVDGVDCHYDSATVTKDFIKSIRDRGYEFHVWTVDNLKDTEEAFRRGAQTVTTNCAKKQLDEYCASIRAKDE